MKVNWDDEIPNIWENAKLMFQTTNQRCTAHDRSDDFLRVLSLCFSQVHHTSTSESAESAAPSVS